MKWLHEQVSGSSDGGLGPGSVSGLTSYVTGKVLQGGYTLVLHLYNENKKELPYRAVLGTQ